MAQYLLFHKLHQESDRIKLCHSLSFLRNKKERDCSEARASLLEYKQVFRFHLRMGEL